MLIDFGTRVSGEFGMSNQLSIASIQSIETLHRSGHLNREIGRILGIERGAVNKYVQRLRAAETLPVVAETGSELTQNRPNLHTGSADEQPPGETQNRPNPHMPLTRSSPEQKPENWGFQ